MLSEQLCVWYNTVGMNGTLEVVKSFSTFINGVYFHSSTHKINFPEVSVCPVYHNNDDKFVHSTWERHPVIEFRIFHILMSCLRTGRVSSVDIPTLRAGRPGDRIPVGGEIFRTRSDRRAGSFPEVKRPGCGVDHPSQG